ncbi:helix-turn-helix transcriptional regulator [Actinoplanes sp. TBRC 11911]|nr:helix-turn-helix transcriptional regulator [Actinoplanes sp. TBRC 11911]
MDAATLPGRACSAAAALEFVGDRWSLLAVREISYGNHHFNEIARHTGAPRDRLAARLKRLVEVGVLTRGDGYHLTEAGMELREVLWALVKWGNKWALTEPVTRLEHHHDHDFVAVPVCEQCGERALASEVSVSRPRPSHTG